MVDENGQRGTQLENCADVLVPSTVNSQRGYAEAGYILDEDRSSSLSDLEDGADEGDMVSAPSALSRQIEADSEAETERLEISPKKNQDHKHSELNAASHNHSSGILVRSEMLQAAEQEIFSDSIVSSPGSSEEDPEMEMRSEHSTALDKLDAHVLNGSFKKRKRQDIEDDTSGDDAEEARRHRKRTQSIRSDVEEHSDLGLSREATMEPMGEMRNDQGNSEGSSSALQSAQNIIKSKSTRAAKGKHGKAKFREAMKNIVEEKQDSAKPGADEARLQTDDEDHAEGEEDDIEAALRDDEEYAKKVAAMDSLSALEKHFAALRDRLYDERLASLNHEIAQVSTPKPSHPEFLRQLECIRRYRDEKFDTEQKLLVYKIKSLKAESLANRSQIHSGYFQTVRDVREKHLDRIGERMSRIRRDHVKTDDKTPIYSIPFPTRRSVQVTQQASYNKEVSILSGVAKYVGFPAAPDVNTALQAEMDEDMERMGISLNQVRNLKPTQPKLSRSVFSSAFSRPAAEEQFLEQNPWANPQHPIHLQHIGRLSRRVSDQTQVPETTVTPLAQKSLVDPNKATGSASTIPELSPRASSTLATLHSNSEGLQERSLEGATIGGDQQLAKSLGKPHQQKERLQSLSPTETRKHSSVYDAGPMKPNSKGGGMAGIEEAPPSPYKPSRIALLGTSSRLESLSRQSPSHTEISGRHATSSPIALHQHARENNLTATTGLSRIGAR